MSLAKEVNKESPMAVLLIKCPHPNRPISTGIEVYGRDFSQAARRTLTFKRPGVWS
jgi:hypothetical protein